MLPAPATEISPPPLGVAGPTEIAVSFDVPSVRPRRRGVLFAGALVATLSIAFIALLASGGDGRTTAAATAPIAVDATAAPETRDAAPVPVDAAATAILEIVTRPDDAAVTVGDRAPTTAPVRLESLPPGSHRVIVELDGYRPLEREITLAAGEYRTLELALAPVPAKQEPVERAEPPPRKRAPKPKRQGKLTVRTSPYSEVYLGSRKLGTTPLANVTLPAGRHRLRFVNRDDGLRATRTVRIRPGRTTRLVVELKPPPSPTHPL